MLQYDDGSRPQNAHVHMWMSRPNQGAGNLLTASGLKPPVTVDGDTIPALQASLQAIEAATGKPAVTYTESDFDMSEAPQHTGGMFEPGGAFGRRLEETLTVEGDHTLRAKATYGQDCKGARELSWSFSVGVGVDAGATGVSSTPIGTKPDGTECLRLTITPRDRYGNHLGPGRLAGFELQPQPGTTLNSAVSDLGDGSYQVDVCWDPASGEPPHVGLAQPERPIVVLTPPDVRRFVYSVKFVCGEQTEDCCGCSPVRPGRYATEINIHNSRDRQALVLKQVIPLVMAGAVRGREPQAIGVTALDRIVLPAHSATMDDCCRITELLLGAKPAQPTPLTIGLLEIVSSVELAVTAVYTATDLHNSSTSIDVETISAN